MFNTETASLTLNTQRSFKDDNTFYDYQRKVTNKEIKHCKPGHYFN